VFIYRKISDQIEQKAFEKGSLDSDMLRNIENLHSFNQEECINYLMSICSYEQDYHKNPAIDQLQRMLDDFLYDLDQLDQECMNFSFKNFFEASNKICNLLASSNKGAHFFSAPKMNFNFTEAFGQARMKFQNRMEQVNIQQDYCLQN
jgi:hypothetical protein